MSKKEYMEILLSQIRNEQAKKLVGQEIEAHIDDQAEAYIEFGVEPDIAEQKAVRSMGDPVETGVSLDRIHKPKMSWGMILLVAIMSVIGLTIQGLSWNQTGDLYFFRHQVSFVIIGFICMMLVCFIDYSRIANRGKILAVIYLIVTVAFWINGVQENGTRWLHIGGISLSWYFVMYLSIPIFGMLLYQYRKQERKHLLVPAAFMLIVLGIFWNSGYSKVVLVNLIIMAAVVLTYAIAKGWYPVKIKRFLTIFWICIAGLFGAVPLYAFARIISIRTYAAERLHYWMKSTDGVYAAYGTYRPIREIIGESSWFGGTQLNWANSDANGILSDYVLLHVTSAYGIFVLLVILVLLAILCCSIFRLSFRQKNQLGTIIGLGCGMIFVVQIVEYVMMNFGFLPGTTVFLPLFSYGGSGTVVSFILLGLLLSIYRYQNLVVERKKKKRLVVKVIDA